MTSVINFLKKYKVYFLFFALSSIPIFWFTKHLPISGGDQDLGMIYNFSYTKNAIKYACVSSLTSLSDSLCDFFNSSISLGVKPALAIIELRAIGSPFS